MPPDIASTTQTMPLIQGGGTMRDNSKTTLKTEYVIYNVSPPTTAKRGAEWFRYGTMSDKDEAIQIARELYASGEFARVEVHEARTLQNGQRDTHVLRVLSAKPWLLRPIGLLAMGCAVLAIALIGFTFWP